MAMGLLEMLAKEGIVGISVGYRRTTSGGGLAASVEDAARALEWTRQNAGRLGVDPRRVWLAGDSAGGHLALSVALGLGAAEHVAPPAAVVAGWYPKGSRLAPLTVGTIQVVAGWSVTSAEPRHWLTFCAREGGFRGCAEWADTPARDDLLNTSAGANVFLPPGVRIRAKHRSRLCT